MNRNGGAPRWLIQLTGWLVPVLLLAGCRFSEAGVGPGAPTPEDAVRGHPVPDIPIQFHGRREIPGGVLVLYTQHEPPDPALPGPDAMMYYTRTIREARGWVARDGAGFGVDQDEPVQGTVDFGFGSGLVQPELRYQLIHGRILAPEAAAIEVVFQDGKRIRDDGAGNVFALYWEGQEPACTLRVYGEDEELLDEIRLTAGAWTGEETVACE